MSRKTVIWASFLVNRTMDSSWLEWRGEGQLMINLIMRIINKFLVNKLHRHLFQAWRMQTVKLYQIWCLIQFSIRNLEMKFRTSRKAKMMTIYQVAWNCPQSQIRNNNLIKEILTILKIKLRFINLLWKTDAVLSAWKHSQSLVKVACVKFQNAKDELCYLLMAVNFAIVKDAILSI